MKAEIAPGYDKNRQKLADIVPIPAPFTLFITPAQVCNLKCNYCTHSLSPEKKKEKGFIQQLQEYEVFLKIARQAAEFPRQCKRVLLTGLGEPLMNPRISDMVALLSELEVAEKYEIFTNATLLTPPLSDRLLAAGLSTLRISIQGLSSEKYRELSGAEIHFEELLYNIGYFFEHRGRCRVYIKIIDTGFDRDDDKEEFFRIFGTICDYMFVEHFVKAQPSMGGYDNRTDNYFTFYGEKAEPRDVCPYMFYTLQTDVMGNTFPCPPLGFPESFSLGNVCQTSLKEIWNGEKLKKLRLAHLNKQRINIPVCGTCDNYMCFTPEADNLDNDTEAIIARMTGRGCNV